MPAAGSIEAKFADERVAQLWEKSLAALEEMPDQPTLVRRAVALGRIQLAGQVPVMCSLAGELGSKEARAYACVCLHPNDMTDVLEVWPGSRLVAPLCHPQDCAPLAAADLIAGGASATAPG